MWFTSKAKNRRLGRGYVLDVKLRSSKVRAARARIAAVGLGTFFAIIFTAYLLWCVGVWALNEFIYENKAFAIQTIDIQTDGAIAPDQLRRWAGLKLNENLLALDMAKVKRDLEMIPRIQSASVDRILPGTLLIRVVEREPLALTNIPRPRAQGSGLDLQTYHLDPDGFVMLPLELNQRSTVPAENGPQLTAISGIDPNEVQPGRRIQNPQLQAALRLLRAFERSALFGLVELKKIDVGIPDLLVVTTTQGSEINFGLSDPEQQIRRWHEIYQTGQRRGKAIGSLDLAVSNSLPLRIVDASAVPQAPPKANRNLANRKKHV
jgi:cell division septal protein FtsQ